MPLNPYNPDKPTRVEVYWNLHKRCWSVRSIATGRIIAHRESLHLMHVKWVVQPGGRARVLREGKKNVHAFARGYLVPEQGDYSTCLVDAGELCDADALMYNPYRMEGFQTVDGGKPVDESDKAYLDIRAGRPRVAAVRPTSNL
tara:strand:+ start:1184 stop:1615 length:432 start_codon:yes stop_codon:yes gene_type:complete